MKSVHKALHLRHHKHTGKLLPHKHTSYRVLFLLMLVPVMAIALVGQFVAATDYLVTATVPAPIPDGQPTIESPKAGFVADTGTTVVRGTCPVIEPSIIITIHDNGILVGSAQCGTDGTFSVPVSLPLGPHTLIAGVVTITGGIGASSTPTTGTRLQVITAPNTAATAQGVMSTDQLSQYFHIVTSNLYVLLGYDGSAAWQGSLTGGRAPYTLQIDWGDGKTDTRTVADQSNQSFSHTYKEKGAYSMVVRATDASGDTISLQLAALSSYKAVGIANDASLQSTPPILRFIEQYAMQIYIGTLSALVFLWYLEHGRHILLPMKRLGGHHGRR